MYPDFKHGHYIWPKPLFVGHEGAIHKAEREDKTVAVKIINTSKISEALTIKYIEIWETFDHPNLLKLDKWVIDGPSIYIFTDMAEIDLFDHIKKVLLPEDDVFNITKQVSQGLKYIHDLDVAHRDVKSDNIVLCKGVWKLIDFGFLEKGKTSIEDKGTPLFTSPEQLQKSVYKIKPTDVWALGITVYEMLYRVTPFDRGTLDSTYKAIKLDQVEYKGKLLSEKMIELLNNTLKKDPEFRWTIEDVLEHLV